MAAFDIENIAKDLKTSLIDKTIISCDVSRDKVVFNTTEGNIVWRTYTECCEECWIEDAQIYPGKVNDVRIILLEEVMPSSRFKDIEEQKYNDFYGIDVITTGGSGRIEFRNTSNGFYGGQLFAEENPDKKD